ncbi:uncharacterized protein BJ212DRAFT_1400380 [Suillus subaureus]|uniref:Uncharacterized protein n=1 Tax=Suillus subaureus TaxID=48587 RepID=A0A9P7DQD3_9AGAM|nr:uncharacterized protein BJ212DRAFT_1400380 [Suillus subaureus]KAG1800526.1 hypothetical protein BJ212DRAFT_1400380 [Suillus subaureus]
MLAMIALLISDWPKYDQQFKPGSYFVLSYLLSIVTPIFFVAWSLHCFIFAMLIASQTMVCHVVTALWMVTYIETILMETAWKYAASLNHARYRQ